MAEGIFPPTDDAERAAAFERIRDRLEPTVRELAAERPEHVYAPFSGVPDDAAGARCLYVHPEGFGCLFGHALGRLGVPREFLAHVEGLAIDDVLRDLSGESWAVEDWAVEVQAAQDREEPWGNAVAYADRVIANRAEVLNESRKL